MNNFAGSSEDASLSPRRLPTFEPAERYPIYWGLSRCNEEGSLAAADIAIRPSESESSLMHRTLKLDDENPQL